MRELIKFGDEPQAEVLNIVATSDLGKPIPLEPLLLHLGVAETEYEPEQFPGLIYRESEGVMLVFASGKVLSTGHNKLNRVADSIERMNRLVEPVSGT
jgi:transcription initiation factor TFIID TATA-box-binding protein